jgi:hypothetical protein
LFYNATALGVWLLKNNISHFVITFVGLLAIATQLKKPVKANRIMSIELLNQKDWVLVPIYIAILVFLTHYWAKKYYQETTYKKYILPALGLKILLGCIASIIYHQYYYKGGDAFKYFETGLKINDIFWQEPLQALDIIFSPAKHFTSKQWQLLGLDAQSLSFAYETNALMCKIGGILSLITFKSYACISLLTAYLSFMGSWKLFLVFKDYHPQLEKEVAISMLFVPSVSFWGGGGLQKETILMASLGYFIYSYFRILTKKADFGTVFTLLLSFGFIAIVRTYIALVLIPAALLWGFMHYKKNLQKTSQKIWLALCVVIVCGFAIVFVSQNSHKYNLSRIVNSAFVYQNGNKNENAEWGSLGYDLGEIEPNVYGIVKSIPICIVTAIYRPSLLDAPKSIKMFSAIENLVLLGLTMVFLFQITQMPIQQTFNILASPEITFCLFYALTMLFIVGFTTMTFGGLVRCRVSALPFFIFALFAFIKHKKIDKPVV